MRCLPFAVALALVLVGCGGGATFPDASHADAAIDGSAGAFDAASPDSSPADAANLDASAADAPGLDAPTCGANGVTCNAGAGVCCGGTCVTGACCTAADCGTDPTGFVCTETHACVDVAGSLDGLLWQLPCAPGATGNSCSTTPTTSVSTTLGGAPGVTYDVTVRLRGVIEQKTYPGGCTSGSWSINGGINGDPYNIYRITVSSPAQTFYVNAGTSYITNTFAIDYQRTFRVDTGATVTLFADAVDGAEIRNLDATGTPISIAGTNVAQPYDGQFIQLDVLSVVPDPVASGSTIGGGTAGFALRYDGAQLATVAQVPALAPADLTMEAWVTAGAFGGAFNTVFGRTYGTSYLDSYTLWNQSGALRTGVTVTGGFQYTSVPWSPGSAWHHLASTFAGADGTTTLYLDGLPVACFVAPGPLQYDTHDVLIGADVENGALDGFWSGTIDEVRLFSTARTATQIWADMHTHRLGPTPGLVGEWTFDEGTGQTSADTSGNGNTVTLGSTASPEASDPAWTLSTAP